MVPLIAVAEPVRATQFKEAFHPIDALVGAVPRDDEEAVVSKNAGDFAENFFVVHPVPRRHDHDRVDRIVRDGNGFADAVTYVQCRRSPLENCAHLRIRLNRDDVKTGVVQSSCGETGARRKIDNQFALV